MICKPFFNRMINIQQVDKEVTDAIAFSYRESEQSVKRLVEKRRQVAMRIVNGDLDGPLQMLHSDLREINEQIKHELGIC